MGKLIDLTGQRFGRLIVIERAEDYISPKGQKQTCWLCQCDCGKRLKVAPQKLKSGSTKSCGCYSRGLNFKDLTGKVFNRLTIIKRVKDYVSPQGINQTQWLCFCICGNYTTVSTGGLMSGHTQSCGCLRKERLHEAIFKNLVGLRFARLVVVNQVENSRSTRTQPIGVSQYMCKCDCGNEVVVKGNALRSGSTKSCGCYKLDKVREMHSGSNCHFWKGGITSLNHQIRNSFEYKQWRTKVFERGNYTCQYSGEQGGRLQAHHKKPFHQIVDEYSIVTFEQALACDELWDIENGAILQKEKHLFFHKVYGNDCTVRDFNDWIRYATLE